MFLLFDSEEPSIYLIGGDVETVNILVSWLLINPHCSPPDLTVNTAVLSDHSVFPAEPLKTVTLACYSYNKVNLVYFTFHVVVMEITFRKISIFSSASRSTHQVIRYLIYLERY